MRAGRRGRPPAAAVLTRSCISYQCSGMTDLSQFPGLAPTPASAAHQRTVSGVKARKANKTVLRPEAASPGLVGLVA